MFMQRRLWVSFTFVLGPDDVEVTEKSLTYSRSYRVSYEHLPDRPVSVVKSSARRLVLAAVLALAALGTGIVALRGGSVERAAPAIWGVLASAAALWYWESRKSYLVFGEGGRALVLFQTRPSRAAVESFVAELMQRRATHFAHRYGSAAPSPVDQIDRLAQLRADGLLSDAEFSALKRQLLGSDRSAETPPTYH